MLSAKDIYVSSASIWEIAIKTKLGKLEGDPDEFVESIEQSGFRELAISAHHAATVYSLSMYHRDPFDRLLIVPIILAIADVNNR
jgi:PIN domain nuclease of toxin-antitoxin system